MKRRAFLRRTVGALTVAAAGPTLPAAAAATSAAQKAKFSGWSVKIPAEVLLEPGWASRAILRTGDIIDIDGELAYITVVSPRERGR